MAIVPAQRRVRAWTAWAALAAWPAAYAQTAPQDKAGEAVQAMVSAQQDTQALPVVIISGSKREQRLDSLNGAAQVADRLQLDDNQAVSTLDLPKVFPDLQMSYSGSQLFPIITLRGVTSAQDFYNPALTVYVDGVPQLPVATIQSLLDVERVELFKGPQGTLYGKSAQGGVLNIVTHQPDNTAQATLRAGVSSYGGYQSQANVSGPLVQDLLYGSVSLVAHDVPGRLHSAVLGDGLGGSQTGAGRFKLRLAPSASAWEMGLTGGRDCARAQQDVYTAYDAVDQGEVYALKAVPAPFRQVHQRRCVNDMAARGQYQWDEWQFNATLSAQRLDIEREFAFGAQYSWQPEHWRQNSQELRLSTRPGQEGAAPGRAWDAVFGLYRQQVQQSRHYLLDMVVPERAPFLDTRSRNQGSSLSAYGDVTWHVSPKADVSTGLRVSRDSAHTDFQGSLMGDQVQGQRRIRQNTWLGRIAGGYQLNAQWRAYVNVAQGYKPAGYALAPSSAADAEGFGRERSNSYEAGARYASPALLMALAAYRVDTRNAQLYGDSNMGYQTLKNMGDTRSTGMELKLDWKLSRQWELGLSGFVSDAVFRRYTDVGNCADCRGNHVPFAPAHGLSLTAKARLRAGETMLRPQVAVRHVGAHYFDTANTLKQQAYTLIDAGLAWSPAPNWELAAYVQNLTDKRYRTYGFSYGPAGNFAQAALGRRWGVVLSYAY